MMTSRLLYLLTNKHSRVLLWLPVPNACSVYFDRLYTYRPGVSSQRVNKWVESTGWVESTEWGSTTKYILHGEQTCDDHVGYVM